MTDMGSRVRPKTKRQPRTRCHMNKQLARLISEYQTSVHAALILMQRSGISMPFSDAAWVETDIPQHGELEGGIPYFKHGYGCAVSLRSGEVDFDFGEQGEFGGFDAWRLARFAGEKLAEYGFDSNKALTVHFDAAVASGALIREGHVLHYVANAPRSRAVEVDSRSPGDNLPCRDQDPVLVLYAHYFLAADLMRENFNKLDEKRMENGHLNQEESGKQGIYLSSWLGLLGVTCEGFRNLRMRLLIQKNRPNEFSELIPCCDRIGRMLKHHFDPLREFRNSVFHLRDDVDAIRKFFDREEERLPWAGDLHTEFAKFFSAYRVLCEVYYTIHDRKCDMNVKQKLSTRSAA
ncbi:conserved protein of unknown function [Ralstonia solanacearum CMR15]|nr:conserved protein of unknown function [Ralstonia solanacearum CMR15]